MEAVGITILIIVATFVCCSFINYAKSCKHEWGRWGEPVSADTRSSFGSANETYQIRLCAKCNQAESHTIKRVSA